MLIEINESYDWLLWVTLQMVEHSWGNYAFLNGQIWEWALDHGAQSASLLL